MDGRDFVTGSLVGDLRACANGLDLYATAADEIVRLSDEAGQERARIVVKMRAWADDLRKQEPASEVRRLADAIERGDHRPEIGS